jgi:hypothetical protein
VSNQALIFFLIQIVGTKLNKADPSAMFSLAHSSLVRKSNIFLSSSSSSCFHSPRGFLSDFKGDGEYRQLFQSSEPCRDVGNVQRLPDLAP